MRLLIAMGIFLEYDIDEPLSPKRACAPFASRESSATISDLSDNDFEQDTIIKAHEHNETTFKVEPPSPTVHNQPLVMSIGFLCSEEEKAKKEAAAAAAAAAKTATATTSAVAVDQKSSSPRPSSHQRVHSGSPLDLLCDAIMDVEFMQAQSQRVAAATTTATDFVQPAKDMVVEEPVKQEARESEHMQDIEAFEDSLFDDVLSNFDEFDDGISDLSSIDSDLLSEESDAETPPSSVSSNERPSMSRESSNKWLMARRRGSKQELRCLACDKPLAQKESTDAGDPVATELATWTWSPSAVFIDWFPKRCPRCERHFTIFNQEWPKRKIKAKKVKDVIATSTVQSEPEFKPEFREPVQSLPRDDDEDDDLFTPLVSVEKPVTFSRRQRPQKPVIHTGMLDTVSALRQVFGE